MNISKVELIELLQVAYLKGYYVCLKRRKDVSSGGFRTWINDEGHKFDISRADFEEWEKENVDILAKYDFRRDLNQIDFSNI